MSGYTVRVSVTVDLAEPVDIKVDGQREERILSVEWEATGWHTDDGHAHIRIRGIGRGSWSVHTTFGSEERPPWAPPPPKGFTDMVIDLLAYSRLGQ